MFGKLSEQFQKSTAPVNSLMALNAKTFKALSEHQTSLFKGLLNDGVNYVNTLKTATDVNHVLAAQKACAEALRDRLANVTKETYHTLDAYRLDATDVLRNSLEQPAATVEAIAASAKPASAQKAPEKEKAKPAPKTASKAKQKAPASAAPKKAVAVKNSAVTTPAVPKAAPVKAPLASAPTKTTEATKAMPATTNEAGPETAKSATEAKKPSVANTNTANSKTS